MRVALLILVGLQPGFLFADSIDFGKQIAPIFSQNCIRCHSDNNQKGDLSLSTFDDLMENEYVNVDDPNDSHLIQLVTGTAGEPPEMPQEGKPLSAAQIALLREWIAAGAVWPEGIVVREKSKADATWWSLQPLETEFKFDQIDGFVNDQLAAKKLQQNGPANRTTLIRRATYDLIGLPPTPAEVKAFVDDKDPQAYEKLVDRLLASPQYGERWGRHWLDVVRFGESNGFERNVVINDLWPFRDFVIRSLNEDKPFDQFAREHIAGDVIGVDQPEVAIGSAFLVAGPYDDVGNQDAIQAAQIRANTIDEIIRATSDAFIGMTLGCARCHDHKFDPILQSDYYAWYSTFAGVRHGRQVLATEKQKADRLARVKPLNQQLQALNQQKEQINQTIKKRGLEQLGGFESKWVRDPSNRTGTEEKFAPVQAKFVRLKSEGNDSNPRDKNHFGIDEFEIWSADEPSDKPINVALATNGAKATGPSRSIEDFPGAYGPLIAIDGKTGERFLATAGHLTIELANPTTIDRVFFSSARNELKPNQGKFAFVADYRIEISIDGKTWKPVADSQDRRPVNESHRNHRMNKMVLAQEQKKELARVNRQLAQVQRQLAEIPALPQAWIGTRDPKIGPSHIFLGGSPQRKGAEVVPAGLSVFKERNQSAHYELSNEASENERRQAIADWIVDRDNPLTPRVLANRLWHYHFGTGIVDTPSDFGYMGSRPTHPDLLDYLAQQLHEHDWRLKPIHRLIMLSNVYRQSSEHRADAAKIDGDARLLWRFPPRRLSAEEIRDTVLTVAGVLTTNVHKKDEINVPDGGPGFRLYRYLQDNVATYVPRDQHGPDTYRRGVYHQNARAALTDLMTDFDQPDCAFSAPRRAETTTPLQALTMLNHRFTLDMSQALAKRLEREFGDSTKSQIDGAFLIAYARQPAGDEITNCQELIEQHGLTAFCRVLLNTSELIYVR